MEVVRRPGGAPGLVVTGRAASLAAGRGVGGWHVSITHTEIVASAVVAAVGVIPVLTPTRWPRWTGRPPSRSRC